MLIYLDTCALQRPLDDQNQFSVEVETNIILDVLERIKASEHDIISSAVLRYEIENNPMNAHRDFCIRILSMANINIDTTDLVVAQAAFFVKSGIKPLDAIHLSSAIAADADFLCTVDKNFLRKAIHVNTSPTKVVSPEELKLALSL